MSEPCAICGAPHSCPHLMRRYDNPKITPFIPGRGRIMEVPRGEEPAMYEVVLVGFPQPEVETDVVKNVTRFVPKRVVALEMASGGCKTVGVVLRDPDFPDPTVWEELPRNAEGEPIKPVLKVSEDGQSAFLGTSDVVVSPLIMESTPRKKPSKIEFLWFQCSQCGWGQRMSKAEAEVDEWEDGSACPHCGVGPIRSSPMGRFR